MITNLLDNLTVLFNTLQDETRDEIVSSFVEVF